jgi:O-antigen/teichoic acid export membrane protein
MSVRKQGLLAGAYLSLREGAGMIVRLLGVLALTRLLGPTQYGLYAGAGAIVATLGTLAQMGCEVHLIRREEEPDEDLYDQTFTYLLIATLIACALGYAVSFWLGDWMGDQRFVGPFRVLLISIPVNVLWVPAQAKLERAFHYKKLAWIEVGGDVTLYGVSLVLAAAGAKVWAPVAGYLAWQAWLLVASCAAASYLPRLAWTRERMREIARWGFAFSSGSWLRQFEGVIQPLVIGHFIGAAGVGYTTLIARLVDTLGFPARASWRLSIVSFGKVQSDLGRLRRGLAETMALQVLALGPVFAGFSLVAAAVVPLVFGHRWSHAIPLFPYLALAALGTAVQTSQLTVLYVAERNLDVAKVQGTRVALLLPSALVLVPAFGLIGWGVASLVTLVSLAVSDRVVRRVVAPDYSAALPWAVAFVPPLFIATVGLPGGLLLLVPTVFALALPSARRQLGGYATLVRSRMRPGPVT